MIPYQSSLGIEINEDALTLVLLKRTLRETRVENSIVIPFSLPLSPEAEIEVIDSIKKFLTNNRVSSERVVVGIPRKSVILKFLEIPSLKMENIPQILEFEIEKHLPFKPEEVYYDFDVIEKSGENLYRIVLAAVKKEVIDSFSALLERIPLSPRVFDIFSFGIFNALRSGKHFPGDGIDAIVFFGSKYMELAIIQDGLLRYSRSLPFGDPDTFVEVFSMELENAFSGIDRKGKEKKIRHLILAGPGAVSPGLIESIKERLSINATIEDLSSKIAMSPTEPQKRQSLIPAIGLALRGLGDGEIKINFIPHEPESKMGKRSLSVAIGLAGIVLFLGLAIFLSYPIRDYIEIKRIEKKTQSLKAEATAVENIQREIKTLEDKRKILTKLKDDDLRKLDALAELTRIAPPDAWFISLDYTESLEQKGQKEGTGKVKREVIISGFATSSSKLIPLLEDSPIFENVEFAGPITSGIEGKERFRIKTLAKKAALALTQDKTQVIKEEPPKKEVPKKDAPKNGAITEENLPAESTGNANPPKPQPLLIPPRSIKK